jgi:DNA-binding CsgD family transcriptional regulator
MSQSNLPPPEARLLAILQHLLELEVLDLKVALDRAALAVSAAFEADKVDVFLHEPGVDLLVAVGTMDTPLARRQQELGLDQLSAADGGSIWRVFQSGQSFRTGHAEHDPDELRGLVDELGVRSIMGAMIEVGGDRRMALHRERAVLVVESTKPEHFSADDLRFLEAVAHWVGQVATLAVCVERAVAEAAETAYRLGSVVTVEALTARQQAVAGLIAAGASNTEIAEQLVITPGTVANHVEHILSRLGFKSRSQIAVWAAERGLRTRGQGTPTEGTDLPPPDVS